MKYLVPFFCLLLLCSQISFAQRNKTVKQVDSLASDLFEHFSFRNIGPAFMSGRIADIAIDPTDESVWYVAVGSGGVWKTINAGTTFEPIFDGQPSYSIGCVTIDPSNPFVVWVGTGENVGGRHVGFGDGIYKSEDGGHTWKNMGLKTSEHISKIIVHPRDAAIIWVAAQGPLWSSSGQRGFYKSTDGGNTWEKTLGDDEWTGLTDFVIDPRNPSRIYAATWQHHRTVAAWMGGGEKTKIYLSTDAGDTWNALANGLPEGKMGKIGLAISPIDPDVVYAAIETNLRKGGIWRSANRGGSWQKMSDVVSGGTGPHYYQELYASPHKFDRLYLMNNRLLSSEDGGKTFAPVNEDDKHGDNHSITFKKSDPNYLLAGTDGGVYESFDLGATWRYMENLPVTQFYKVAVDDTAPFYNIYGGTQDNSTQGGPSRTDNLHGIRNADWRVVLNWDGQQPATEPGNPNIIYGQRQEGNISRIDMKTGEVVDIQPQPAEGEATERFNWDAPILVSPHNPTTLYFASQRVWKSDDRGDSWISISPDLTKNQDRIKLPIMGKQQSWDSPWDVYAMSSYNTITSLAESPQKQGLIYVGTDDGLLQLTEDGGQSWKKIDVAQMGVPATAFINDVKADLYDESTVYVALDNHKYGDYKPYLVKSTNKGVTWQGIDKGLGDKNLVWRIVQDHENSNLFFAATEFGIYFSSNGGASWINLSAGVPTISFRDLVIQKRENDLVAASFGRGFFVLDDYSALRKISPNLLDQEAALFKPRKAWWYIPKSVIGFDDKRGSQGTQHFVAPNPDFGAIFTYYLKDAYKSDKALRQENEKDEQGNIPFVGWDNMEKELREDGPYVFLEIKDVQGDVVNRVMASNEKGFHRVTWNLSVGSPDIMTLREKEDQEANDALMVAPGTYAATLNKYEKGTITPIADAVDVNVIPLQNGSLTGADYAQVAAFWRTYEKLTRDVHIFQTILNNTHKTVDKLWYATMRTNVSSEVIEKVASLKERLDKLRSHTYGHEAKNEMGEKGNPTIGDRLFSLDKGVTHTTYGPTITHKETIRIINKQLEEMRKDFQQINDEVSTLAQQVVAAGGPWIEGQE